MATWLGCIESVSAITSATLTDSGQKRYSVSKDLQYEGSLGTTSIVQLRALGSRTLTNSPAVVERLSEELPGLWD
jgi:hypothetical protein